MGYELYFGPTPTDLAPGLVEHPVDWESWQGTTHLDADGMKRTARLAETSGFTVAQASSERVILEGAFESFEWGPRGGWLGKPAEDEQIYEAQLSFLRQLCDSARWSLYDPAGACLLYVPGREVAAPPEPWTPGLPSDAEIQRGLTTVASREGDLLGAVTMLSTIGDWTEALTALSVCLQPGYPTPVRRQAALAFEGVRAQALPFRSALIDALADADAEVRASVAAALGFLGPDAERALPKLRALLQDTSSSVRSVAKVSIAKVEARRSSKPVPGAQVPATVLFRGAKMVIARTKDGKNVTLEWVDAPLSKGDDVSLRIDDAGVCSDVTWTDAEGVERSRRC